MAELSSPTLSKVEFGVKRFLITDEHFMKPCSLFDLMTKDIEICAAGVFVGETETTPESQQRQVDAVKSALVEDRGRIGKDRQFMPGVQMRKFLWPEYGSLYIVPQEQKGKAYCDGRMSFLDNIVSWDFSNQPVTELENALRSGGINGLLTEFFKRIGDENKTIWNGAGFPMAEGRELKASSNLNMSAMDSPFIAKLKNTNNEDQKVFVGINLPTVHIGTEYSTFNCHIKDFAFESVNRHCAGSEKIWFIIPPAYYMSFTMWMSMCGMAGGGTDTNCVNFLQHKHNFIDPRAALHAGFPVRTVRQRVGDVVYVLPFSIHWGFNLGYNINEAVNVASLSWAPSGMLSKPMCQCSDVSRDMDGTTIKDVLKAMAVPEDQLTRWQKGQLLGLFPQADVRNPYSADTGMVAPDPALLLGTGVRAPDLDCKEVETTLGLFAGRVADHFIGGLDVTVPEDEEAADAGENRVEMEEEEEEDDDDDDEEEEEPKNDNKGTYKCPLCQFDSKRYGKRGMKSLRCHARMEHRHQEDALLERIKKLYSRENRDFSSEGLRCDVCGVFVRGQSCHLERHQKSRNCMKRRDFSSEGLRCDVCGVFVGGQSCHLERHKKSRNCKKSEASSSKRKRTD